jgi:hypothetical protein
MVNGNDAAPILKHGFAGAGLHADGVLTVIAAKRKVVGKYILNESAVRHLLPLSPGKLHHTPPAYTIWQVVLVPAGDHTGLASGADLHIQKKCRLFHHSLR